MQGTTIKKDTGNFINCRLCRTLLQISSFRHDIVIIIITIINFVQESVLLLSACSEII
jgi:hypothetical protein